MRFVYPAYLLLFIPLLLGLAFSFRHVRGMMKFRKRLAFGLRLILLSCIVFALAGPEAKRPNRGLCTIFIVDRSDSISEGDYAYAQDFIKQSLKKQDEDNMVGIIAFGREPMVERLAGKWRDMGPIQSLVNAAASDLSAAIRLASASFPEGKARRIVLISDGNETMGDAAGAASAAAADGIAIDHVLLGTKPREGEVTVLDTTMPTEARVDQPFDVRVVVAAQSPLAQQVAKGRMRADLFARLNGVTIELPPLRQRMNELPFLLDRMHYRIAHRQPVRLGHVGTVEQWQQFTEVPGRQRRPGMRTPCGQQA